MRDAEKRNLRKFSKIIQSSGSEKSSQLIHLNGDYFGRMRGEIISVLKCPKKTFVVVSSRLNCSTELEVHDQTGERFFINPHSRLVQKTKNHAVCQTVGLGNVWKVQNAIGDFVYITQNKNVQIFPGNVKSLHGTNIFLADENISLSNLSFSGLGLYDDIYLKARNKYIFEPTTYQAMQSGITMFISNGKESEEDILSGNLNLLDMINYDELLGVIFDVSLFSWITPFMTVLGSGSLENI